MTAHAGTNGPLDPAPGGEDSQAALDRIQEAAAVEAGVSEEHEYGRAGRPFDRRSPFLLGLYGALGVATAAVGVLAVVHARQILLLLGLAFFIAVGLDPAVTWLSRHRVPRGVAVVLVLVATLGSVIAFLAFAVPVVVSQATQFAGNVPHYLRKLDDPSSSVGKLATKYHVAAKIQTFLNGSSSSAVTGGVVKVGEKVFSVAYSTVIVIIVAVYLLADLPRVKRGLYRVAPRSRRPRMVLLTDEVFARVGGYVLGNLAISVVSAIGATIWALIWGIPDPLLLGVMVGLFDLVPIVGSTVGGAIVALVALVAVSVPVAIFTVVFFVLYRFVEDYVLTPRIMGRTVDVPGLVTVVAVLIGGSILGLVGALIAIPVAAGIKLLLAELVVPRLDDN